MAFGQDGMVSLHFETAPLLQTHRGSKDKTKEQSEAHNQASVVTNQTDWTCKATGLRGPVRKRRVWPAPVEGHVSGAQEPGPTPKPHCWRKRLEIFCGAAR